MADNLGFAIPVSYVKDFLRNREAFSFDKDNPNTGYRYLDPPRRLRPGPAQGADPGPRGEGPVRRPDRACIRRSLDTPGLGPLSLDIRRLRSTIPVQI